MCLSVLMFAAATAAPALVPDGIIGQSGTKADPVEWNACSFCVSDQAGNVYLPGGWRVPPSGGRPERMPRRVKGILMTDGRTLYSWRAEHGSLRRLDVREDGLAETKFAFRTDDWRLRLAFAPDGCRRGFASKAKLFALDMEKRQVRGWDESGGAVGVLFEFGGRLENPELVRSLAIYPETGELLLGTYWPECKVHRFGVDGMERKDQVWPYRFMATGFAIAGGKLFATGERAQEMSDRFGAPGFGVMSGETYGVARGAGGWWLATTQGAQFYSDAAVRSNGPATCRIGGLPGVTALALSQGRVVAAAGYAVHSMWLDDRRGEPLACDHNWCSIGKWSGAVDSIVRSSDGGFILRWRDGAKEAAWAFDPRITAWKDRKLRLHPVAVPETPAPPNGEATAMGLRAVAESDEIVLYDGARRVGSYPVSATAIAAEGRWLVAYVPAAKGIVRFKVRGKE